MGVYDSLTKESDILYSYIVPCYDVLHTQGKEYIVNDILDLMRERFVCMILFHASYMEIVKPDIMHSRTEVDFGCGFYTTPLIGQAEKWCEKFQKKRKAAVINQYDFNEEALENCRVLRFDSYSEEWLDFIVNCRRGTDKTDYDIVIGGVVNDKVFNTVELYSDELIDKAEAIKRLRYEKPNAQIAFRTQATIDEYLTFEGSRTL